MSSVCVNHPNRSATARCICCLKPVCQECLVSVSGSKYCSQDCAEKAAKFDARFRPEEPGFFERLKGMVANLLLFAGMLVAVVAVCAYVFKIQFFVNLLKGFGLPGL